MLLIPMNNYESLSDCCVCVNVVCLQGKDVLYNIVSFARDSVRAHVTTLRPDNFPSDRKEPWLVDFFAPVCTLSLPLHASAPRAAPTAVWPRMARTS